MKQTTKVYVQYLIETQKEYGEYKATKKEIKEFKSYIAFLKWKQSMKLYLEIRKKSYTSIKMLFDTWIKDCSTGSIWKTVNVLTQDGIERILLEEEVPYLKNKVWDKEKGWTSIPIQYELLNYEG